MAKGYTLRALREKAGMSQDELSLKSGVSRTTIWALESGQEKVTTTKTLSKLANALNVQISDILLDSD